MVKDIKSLAAVYWSRFVWRMYCLPFRKLTKEDLTIAVRSIFSIEFGGPVLLAIAVFCTIASLYLSLFFLGYTLGRG
jgi:uncharacterized membrane protein YphA (DoxX/SURF4 family)